MMLQINIRGKIQTIIASWLLLGLTAMFGVMGKPTEMGFIVLAGTICLIFLNIDKIKKVKGAGFEAEMKDLKKSTGSDSI